MNLPVLFLQLSVHGKHTAEDAESQAKDARQRADEAVSEKNALKETLERQISILEDKVCRPQLAYNTTRSVTCSVARSLTYKGEATGFQLAAAVTSEHIHVYLPALLLCCACL